MVDEKLIGTCKYVITENGTLVISPAEGTTGQLYLEDASGRWPWNGSDIKKVRVDGQIIHLVTAGPLQIFPLYQSGIRAASSI